MSHNHDVSVTPPSRRSVVKGAAWAVPAVVVAAAAPTVAASLGFLTFSGRACKLPGNSQSIFKGYVFELFANNVAGPGPRDAITEITSITVSGFPDLGSFIVVVKGENDTCSCGPCPGAVASHTFCTADGTLNQRILIFTSDDLTGNSANSTVTVTYRQWDCNDTASCGTATEGSASATIPGTPPVQGPCTIIDPNPPLA
jgi:hypothetical protein